MKYKSSSTHCSKVISKIEVFKKRVKLQGQGHSVKYNGTHRKVLSQGIFRLNIKVLALTVQELLARLKFSKKWFKLQGQGHIVKKIGTHRKVLSQGIFM